MFKRLRLWFWKWFRPSKYVHHLAEELAAEYRAGIDNPDPGVVQAVSAMARDAMEAVKKEVTS